MRQQRNIDPTGKGPFYKKNGKISDEGLFDDAFDSSADAKLIKLMEHRQMIEDIETVLKERAAARAKASINECFEYFSNL